MKCSKVYHKISILVPGAAPVKNFYIHQRKYDKGQGFEAECRDQRMIEFNINVMRMLVV